VIEREPRGDGVTVTFRLPTDAHADEAWIAGDFNNWSTTSHPLERTPEGDLVCRIVLEPGRSYRFRYYLGNGRWENDWHADAYVDNEFGGADSVVVVDGTYAAADARARDSRGNGR